MTGASPEASTRASAGASATDAATFAPVFLAVVVLAAVFLTFGSGCGSWRLLGTRQTVADSAPAHHVAVGLVERRRVALHGHAEDLTEVDCLGIGHAELLG